MILRQNLLLKNLKTPVVAIIIFSGVAAIRFFFRDDAGGRALLTMASFVTSYYAYHYLKTRWDQISRGILIGMAAFMFFILVAETVKAVISNAQFDFMCFYMQGQLGLHNLNFYDPKSFNILLQNYNFNYAFEPAIKAEILDVGFLSPPITMLFFAPLASMDYHTGKLILALFIFIFIFADTFLANAIFVKKGRSIYSFLFIFIIITLLPGTGETVGYIQTNFFLLFFLLLAIYKINKPISGLYLALSLIIKPISGFLILFFISGKKWKQVIYFVSTVIVLVSITAFFWGFQNIIGFFQSPPTQRLPNDLYVQNINQSILAVFNRNLQRYEVSQDLINSFYYLAAIIMTGLSYAASKGLNKIDNYLSISVLILCMLMIYPSSLKHYMVYLSPALIYFLFEKQDNKYFWLVMLPAIGFLGSEVFFTYLILWIFLLYRGIFFSGTAKSCNKLIWEGEPSVGT